MNSNSKRKKIALRKQMRKNGFPTSVYRKKLRPFPRPNTETDLSLKTQAQMFHGVLYNGK